MCRLSLHRHSRMWLAGVLLMSRFRLKDYRNDALEKLQLEWSWVYTHIKSTGSISIDQRTFLANFNFEITSIV